MQIYIKPQEKFLLTKSKFREIRRIKYDYELS